MRANNGQSDEPSRTEATQPNDSLSRRSTLKRLGAGGLGVVSGSIFLTQSVRVDGAPITCNSFSTENCGGSGNPTWNQHGVNERPYPYKRANLGSGLEHTEQDPGGTHRFNLSGDFAILTQGGEIANPQYTSVINQEMRIENHSPSGLSIFTSSNPHENAMYPNPPNLSNQGATFSGVTGALAAAATILDAPTSAAVLSAASLSSYLLGLVSNGGGGDTKRWNSSYGRSSSKGGHHTNFGVDEHGGGTIKVYSEIAGVSNGWKLNFNYGLSNVSKI